MTTRTGVARRSAEQVRRIRVAAQGLGGAGEADLGALMASAGLVRTLGGADVYLALRARAPGLTRAAVDAAVVAGALAVRPAARGCIYLVPASLTADCLRFAERASRSRIAREHAKVGIEDAELEEVAAAVLAVLRQGGPATTQALRSALPDGTLRSLGEAGKKLGISSTLPPALRRLEFDGRIERTLDGGRLDSERYLWQIPARDPFAGSPPPESDAALHGRFADLYWRAAGAASSRDFAAWLGLSQRDAKAAASRVPLVPIAVDGSQDELLVHEAHRPWLDQPQHLDPHLDPHLGPHLDPVALLPFADNLVALHGGPRYLVAEQHHGIEVPTWGRGGGGTLGDVRHAQVRTIVAGDRLVGVWELEPNAGDVVWAAFDDLDPATSHRIDQIAEDTGRFLTEQLGHGRSFSIDNEKHMGKRVDLVRRLQR